VSAAISGQTYQLCAVDDPFKKKLFINNPDKLQCMAMRAMLYFWKILRIREAVVFNDQQGSPVVTLDFGEGVRVQIDLPAELGMTPVSPVRMIANLVFGKLHDEAIATRGVMTSDALPSGIAEDLVDQAQEAEEESTGVHSQEEIAARAMAQSPVPMSGAPRIGNEDVTRVSETLADELPPGIGDALVAQAIADEGIEVGDEDIEAVEEIDEIEDISDSLILDD
jgi:hypothetical protein